MPINESVLDRLPEHPALLIGGDRVTSSSGGVFDHIWPATGKITRQVPLAGRAEVDRAVSAARTAFPAWRALPVNQRRDLLLRFAAVVQEHAEELVVLTVADNATPVSIASGGPGAAADHFAYYAGWADKVGGEVIQTWDAPAFDYATEEPFGVVAVLIPWNGPVYAIGMTVAPALAAGNCIVLKPPELAPYAAVRMGELFLEAGFPPGVVNVVPAGPEGGEALCSHPGVDKIHFTGGGPTAKKVLAAALTNLTPVGLELGGKSANLIFDDADVPSAALMSITGAIGLSGQGCINGTRILVQSGVYDEVLGTAKAMLEQMPIGDPTLETTVMGPVVSAAACDRIMGFIDRAKASGATLVTGGNRLGGDYADGYFIAPTIFGEVDNSLEVAQQEIFGPVLAFLRFDTEEEAVAIANDTTYGLAGYVCTHDLRRAHRVADALDVGNVWVNEMGAPLPAIPFGGAKQSGYGRLGGIHGVREFTRSKNVRIPLG
jgi:acyl-CoA reductase-like NAD-dependent aldehyde dehydrogenase